jgi:glycosyltransferase involved in cell wall biosynthesis
MPKPKVLILGKLPPPYFGPAIATQILLQSNLKIEFDLCHLNTGLNETINSIGKFTYGKIWKGIGRYFVYIKVLIRFRPQLILIPNGQTTTAFFKDSIYILLGKLSGSKILLQLRGSDWLNWLNKSNGFIRWYVKQNLKLASAVIVLGKKLRFLFTNNFTPERIFVVPNGANFSFSVRSGKRSQEMKILYFANLFRSKGVEDVINSAAILKDKTHTPFKFILTGTWNDENVRQACFSNIQINLLPVHIFPPASDKEKLKCFEEADIFVFPPRNPEGHPWVIVEAMAAGLPIISTDQGAITESVIDGVNGFIVEPGSPIQIAEKIEYLILNEDVRKMMGKESRRLYEENFTEEIMINKFATVFNTVLNMP